MLPLKPTHWNYSTPYTPVNHCFTKNMTWTFVLNLEIEEALKRWQGEGDEVQTDHELTARTITYPVLISEMYCPYPVIRQKCRCKAEYTSNRFASRQVQRPCHSYNLVCSLETTVVGFFWSSSHAESWNCPLMTWAKEVPQIMTDTLRKCPWSTCVQTNSVLLYTYCF